MSDAGKAKSKASSERRREQNRIAQRNHRSKIREKQIEPKGTEVTAADGLQTSEPDLPSLDMQVDMPMDGLQDMYDMDHPLTQLFPQYCSCNSTFGPCDFHRRQLRGEMSAQAFSTMYGLDASCLSGSSSNDATISNGAIMSAVPASIPTSSLVKERADPDQYPTNRYRKDSGISVAASLPQTTSDFGTDGMCAVTDRIIKILRYIEHCDFGSFDEVAALYYTYDFTKSSLPQTAQSVSRGRRLRSLLASIQDSASNWTLWEVRGYQEKIVEAAETIYSNEIDRVRRNLKGLDNDLIPPSLDPQVLCSLFKNAQNPSADAQAMLRKQHAELVEFQNACQNKLPNLWALLLGLTHQNGTSGELAALTTLSLLCRTAQSPSSASPASWSSSVTNGDENNRSANDAEDNGSMNSSEFDKSWRRHSTYGSTFA